MAKIFQDCFLHAGTCGFRFNHIPDVYCFLEKLAYGEVRWGALPLPIYPVKFIVAAGSLGLCVQLHLIFWRI